MIKWTKLSFWQIQPVELSYLDNGIGCQQQDLNPNKKYTWVSKNVVPERKMVPVNEQNCKINFRAETAIGQSIQ